MTSAPLPSFADWLRSDGTRVIAKRAASEAFGATAISSEARCALDDPLDAQAEANAQLAFLGPARAIETIVAVGRHVELVGTAARVAGIVNDALVSAFVLSADEQPGGVTQLSIVRSL